MPTLLVANNTDEFRTVLAEALLMNKQSPDVLVLNIAPEALGNLLRDNEQLQNKTNQQLVREHLIALNISRTRKGFHYLCIGIPLFAHDPSQLLSKEVYPAIAQACGYNQAQIEHAIRTVIKDAWSSRSAEVWEQYFPGYKAAPTNKQFIGALAQLLK